MENLFDLSVSTTEDTNFFLKAIFDEMAFVLRKHDCIVANERLNGRAFLKISSQPQFLSAVTKKWRECVTEVLAIGFKRKFLQENLKVADDSLIARTALNTMTIFDSKSDKKQIKEELQDVRSLSLDGFFNFKMQEIKHKWEEIVALADDHNIVLGDSKVSYDFLSFLLEAIPSSFDGLKVLREKDNVKLFDKNDKRVPLVILLSDKKDIEETVLFNLVCYRPKHVKILQKENFSSDFLSIIKTFFS